MREHRRERGVVKWFNENRGHGCIRREVDGRHVYVHYADIEGSGYRTLNEGEQVEFELVHGPKGLHALHVSSK
jgi:CspA family cold shock protein